MSTVAGRKKSTISTNGVLIDTPIASNTFLNQAANQSTSLYQQCSQLRARLLRIQNFAPYFAISLPSESRASTDPVSQIWDCFALGIPLCFLHNLLPGVPPIALNLDPARIDTSDEKAIKKAILYFAMAVGNANLIDQHEQFTATQLLDRGSTEGFVKVVNCVTRLVDQLPEDLFEQVSPPSPPSIFPSDSTDSLVHLDLPAAPPSSAPDAARNNIIREIVETERKYVRDLEHMQKYAQALVSTSAIDQDTIHVLFPGLGKLLDFQRRFLIKLEGCAELPWKEQRWGFPFIENEQEFAVYEPYCANYTHATEVMQVVEQNLMTVTLIMYSELPAFLIKPVQRICKYPLLLESLLKASSTSDYPYYDELKSGCASVKRIADRINEAQRRAENSQTVQSLETRVEDWKGHHLTNFGDLLLDEIFMVTKMDIDREYHVFLFEKIILCCKEVIPGTNGNRKPSKTNSLKKQSTLSLPGGAASSKKKNTPLLLKGRIFLNNVTHVRPSNYMGNYSLQVWWRGDDDNEYFTLRCRNEEQLKQWETQINRLIKETAARRASERNIAALAAHVHNNGNPAPPIRQYSDFESMRRKQSPYVSANGVAPGPSSGHRYNSSNASPDESRGSSTPLPNGHGPSGYPQSDDFEADDDFEEYPPVTGHYHSGRGTPLGSRRGHVAQSMFPERDVVPGYDRPRARTEDTNGPIMRQWRKNGHPMPPPPPAPIGGLPAPGQSIRPTVTRTGSTISSMSDASSATMVQQRPSLRSQFSSSKLSVAYEHDGGRATPPVTKVSQPVSRSRSASQPTAYSGAKVAPPPMPNVGTWAERSKSTLPGPTNPSKRGSRSSGTTADSSDESPHASPITPYGASDPNLVGPGVRPARSQTFSRSNPAVTDPHLHLSPLVKVKVHFFEDIFVIQVPRHTEYTELVERVGRKIRLCGPRREDGPLRVKYVDEDGDMVSLGSNEDVQMAFETTRPFNQVTLFVQ